MLKYITRKFIQLDALIWSNNPIYVWLWDHTWGSWYSFRNTRRLRKDIIKKFGKMPEVGDVLCDCSFRHLPIRAFEERDIDGVIFENGTEYGIHCSLLHCCDPVPHPRWEHPNLDFEKLHVVD